MVITGISGVRQSHAGNWVGDTLQLASENTSLSQSTCLASIYDQ